MTRNPGYSTEVVQKRACTEREVPYFVLYIHIVVCRRTIMGFSMPGGTHCVTGGGRHVAACCIGYNRH